MQDFKYISSWMASTEADVKTHKAEAWRACNKLKKKLEIQPVQTYKDQPTWECSRISAALWF